MMKLGRWWMVVGLAVAGVAGSASADLRLPKLFSDHMILQRVLAAPVWGWASPGAKVTVGRGAACAMTRAMADAGVAPDEIDYIVAHGTSTSLNDVTETRAIKAAFGSAAAGRAISSPKSMIGHLVGAAGIASVLTAIGALRDQVVPPTQNLFEPDPECDLDYVPLVARRMRVDTAMVNGFGFGGQNAVAIFRRYQG